MKCLHCPVGAANANLSSPGFEYVTFVIDFLSDNARGACFGLRDIHSPSLKMSSRADLVAGTRLPRSETD